VPVQFIALELKRTLYAVEACKDGLTTNRDLQSSVDWLTEVIHRFTDAYMKGKGPTTVNMDVLMHAEKVSSFIGFGYTNLFQI
jgi:hypothetical protein